MPGIFLTAEWRDLVMLNYEVDGGLLHGRVPPGTVLDSFGGRIYVSLVGFRFRHTRLLGRLPVPFHADFEEVNLRFYVRRKEGDEERRGVVFVAEIVPRRAVAQLARKVYGENYVRLPMRHSIGADGNGMSISYEFRLAGAWCRLHGRSAAVPQPVPDGSLEQFITEHYWGYCGRRGGGAVEYHVTHPPWDVAPAGDAGFEGDAAGLYGAELGKVIRRPPDSAFLVDGSEVTVLGGRIIE